MSRQNSHTEAQCLSCHKHYLSQLRLNASRCGGSKCMRQRSEAKVWAIPLIFRKNPTKQGCTYNLSVILGMPAGTVVRPRKLQSTERPWQMHLSGHISVTPRELRRASPAPAHSARKTPAHTAISRTNIASVKLLSTLELSVKKSCHWRLL